MGLYFPQTARKAPVKEVNMFVVIPPKILFFDILMYFLYFDVFLIF